MYEWKVGGDDDGVASVDDKDDDGDDDGDDVIAVKTLHATVFRCATCQVLCIKKLKSNVVPDDTFFEQNSFDLFLFFEYVLFC